LRPATAGGSAASKRIGASPWIWNEPAFASSTQTLDRRAVELESPEPAARDRDLRRVAAGQDQRDVGARLPVGGDARR
jgi:hypothetical protein